MAKRKTYRKRSRNRRRTRRRRKQRRRKTRKRRRRRRRRAGAKATPPVAAPPPASTSYEGIKRVIKHNRKVHLASLVAELGPNDPRTETYRRATDINNQVVAHARTLWQQRNTHPPGLTEEQFRQVEREAMRADRDAADNENEMRNARARAVAREDAAARLRLGRVQQVGVPARVPLRRSGHSLRRNAMERAARKAAKRKSTVRF